MDDVWFLKQIDWLDELSPNEWSSLQAQATRREFEEGATVFEPTQDPRSVYLLEQGRVRIYRLAASGHEATLGLISPGEVFGELAGFGDYARESFAVAQARSSVWRIPVPIFRDLVKRKPHLVLEVTRQMGQRMKRVESRVESLVFRNVRSRLGLALLELAEDFGTREGDRIVLNLKLSQGELATLIGASRQSVNAVMARFGQEGLIAQQADRLEILAPERLRQAIDAE